MSDKLLKYFLKPLLCVILAPMIVSCGKDSRDDDSPVAPEEQAMVTVALSARAVGASAVDDTPDAERMHNLRIVILSKKRGESWAVEHNYYEGFTSGVTVSDTRRFKVKANTDKRIYLIANGGDCEIKRGSEVLDISDASLYVPDARGRSVMDDASLTVAADGAMLQIPMTAVYEISVGKTDVESGCYLVRAVNKLTLNVKNNSGSTSLKRNIRLLGWTLDKTADASYLMAHVNRTSVGAYWVADTDRKTRKTLSGNWVDWLVEETKKLNETDIPRYQWLTDYEIPVDAVEKPFTCNYETPAEITPAEPTSTFSAPAVYLAESMARIEGENPLKLQEYVFTLRTEELATGSTNWKRRDYTATLPQVASLFRNTHVVINVSIGNAYDFTLKVEEQPYSYVNLNPDFGLDRDEDGNIMKGTGRDSSE